MLLPFLLLLGVLLLVLLLLFEFSVENRFFQKDWGSLTKRGTQIQRGLAHWLVALSFFWGGGGAGGGWEGGR